MINIIRALVGLIVTSAAISSVHAEDIVRLGHNRTWSNTALSLGLANGDFSKFGVNVVEHEFTTPADIITAIASGDLDAGTVPAETSCGGVAWDPGQGGKRRPGTQQSANRLYGEDRLLTSTLSSIFAERLQASIIMEATTIFICDTG